jgi:5'(3')-deoxyribonucleotidase
LKPLLGIDIDGTLADQDTPFRKIIFEVTDGRVDLKARDIKDYEYEKNRDAQGNKITHDEWREVLRRYCEPEVIVNLAPLPHAVETVLDLCQDFEPHIMTSRHPFARAATLHWLQHHGLGELPVHFVPGNLKHESLMALDYAVEDHYAQAHSFARVGVPALLLRRPYNFPRAGLPGLEWADGWPDAAARLRSGRSFWDREFVLNDTSLTLKEV